MMKSNQMIYVCNNCTFLSVKIIPVVISSLVDKLILSQSLKTLSLFVHVPIFIIDGFNSVGAILFEALKMEIDMLIGKVTNIIGKQIICIVNFFCFPRKP